MLTNAHSLGHMQMFAPLAYASRDSTVRERAHTSTCSLSNFTKHAHVYAHLYTPLPNRWELGGICLWCVHPRRLNIVVPVSWCSAAIAFAASEGCV